MTNLTLTAKLKSGTELCLYDGEIDSSIWAEGYGLKHLLTISNPVKVEICNNFRYPHNIVFNDMEDLLCFIKEKSYEKMWRFVNGDSNAGSQRMWSAGN